jgi:prolyl oligopeptidase
LRDKDDNRPLFRLRWLMTAGFRVALAFGLFPLVGIAQDPAPETAKRPVTDEYQGVKVTDDYRWLETWEDPAVKEWSGRENARTRHYLDSLPSRSAVQKFLMKASSVRSATYRDLVFRGGLLFAEKDAPPQQHPVLVAMPKAGDPAGTRVVFDPNASTGKGSRSVDFFSPSLDGRYVAAAVSENGSEDASAYVFEVATGKELKDVVPRVNFATGGGSIAWNGDASGFFYTRYPQGRERPPEDLNFFQQVYFHKLGTDSGEDSYVIGKDFPRIAEIQLHSSDDGKFLLAAVANGDGGEFAHYLMDSAGRWTQITRFEDAVVSVKFGVDHALYLLSRKNAPRGRILRLAPDDTDPSHAREVVAESPAGGKSGDGSSIADFVPTEGRLYVVDILGGPSRVRVFDSKGNTLPAPALPPISSVSDLVAVGKGDVLFQISSYLEPSAWSLFAAGGGLLRKTALSDTSPLDFRDAEVVREFATSKDGTSVPLNIVRPRGFKPDGTRPLLLTGYGGFDISLTPIFVGSLGRLWLDAGGVLVVANLRGGGEYGEEWHKAGNLTRKQTVFDDFLASAEYVIEKKYTSKSHLAIQGGSNGGLLMGAALTQRPDLFRAVVSEVGIYDMLRVELDPNGSFNITEYGTVKDPGQFKALHAYSPYHHVKDGTAYPAILMHTGENDHRVNPMQSRKMIARLQAASLPGRPILLRTSSSAGHGFGTAVDESIELNTDVFTFLFEELGVRYPARSGT